MPLFRRGSYANVTATAALVIALGGTSYAAAQITSAQIKNGTIRAVDLHSNAVTASKIKNNAVTGPKIKNSVVGSAKLSAEAQSRLAYLTDIGDLPAGSTGVTIADLPFSTGGKPGTNQLVLITFQTQLDHDDPVSGNCTANFSLRKDASAIQLGFWSQEIYAEAVGAEDNLSFSMVVSQPARTTATYHVVTSNPCSETLWTDGEIMTAQSFARAGNGGSVPARTPAAPAPREAR